MSSTDDLHTRLVAEVQRRLVVCRAAQDWYGELVRVSTDAFVDDIRAVGAHINLHDPADAIRRYEADLRRLERHRSSGSLPHQAGVRQTVRSGVPGVAHWACLRCNASWTLAEAHDLGIVHDDVLQPLTDPNRPCDERCVGCHMPWPCPDQLDVAASLGVDVE